MASATSALTSGSAAVSGSLAGSGDIVSHNVSEFATAAQGALAATAIQSATSSVTGLTFTVNGTTVTLAGAPQGTPAAQADVTTGTSTALYVSPATLAGASVRSCPNFSTIVCEGDSLTDVAGPTGPSGIWPLQLLSYLPELRAASYANVATSGEKAQQMQYEYATQGHLYAPKPGQLGLFTLLAGTNDIGAGTSGSTTFTYLQYIWAAARADGFRVMAFTVPQNASCAASGTLEIQRQALNSLILSATSNWDYCVDIDKILTYTDMSDNTHPTVTGNGKIAGLVAQVLQGMGQNHSSIGSMTINGTVSCRGTNTIFNAQDGLRIPICTITPQFFVQQQTQYLKGADMTYLSGTAEAVGGVFSDSAIVPNPTGGSTRNGCSFPLPYAPGAGRTFNIVSYWSRTSTSAPGTGTFLVYAAIQRSSLVNSGTQTSISWDGSAASLTSTITTGTASPSSFIWQVSQQVTTSASQSSSGFLNLILARFTGGSLTEDLHFRGAFVYPVN